MADRRFDEAPFALSIVASGLAWEPEARVGVGPVLIAFRAPGSQAAAPICENAQQFPTQTAIPLFRSGGLLTAFPP